MVSQGSKDAGTLVDVSPVTFKSAAAYTVVQPKIYGTFNLSLRVGLCGIEIIILNSN